MSAEISFSVKDATKSLAPKVSAKILGMKIPLSLPASEQNACIHLKNSACPLNPNQEVTFFVEMPVLKSYPAVKTEFEVNLIGDNQKSQMCFKIDGQIIN